MHSIDSPEFQRVWFWVVIAMIFFGVIVVGALETPR
jgi:hypothetical protein